MKLGVFTGGALASALGLGASFAARADTVNTVMTDSPGDRLSPAALIQGPSLRETGRVGVLAPEDASGIPGGRSSRHRRRTWCPPLRESGTSFPRPAARSARRCSRIESRRASRRSTIAASKWRATSRCCRRGSSPTQLVLRWTDLPRRPRGHDVGRRHRAHRRPGDGLREGDHAALDLRGAARRPRAGGTTFPPGCPGARQRLRRVSTTSMSGFTSTSTSSPRPRRCDESRASGLGRLT